MLRLSRFLRKPSRNFRAPSLRPLHLAIANYELREAEAELERLRQSSASQEPYTARTLLELELALSLKLEDGSRAARVGVSLLRLDPKYAAASPVGAANIGVVFAITKQFDRGIEVLETIDPEHWIFREQAAYWLASCYAPTGRLKEAVSLMEGVHRKASTKRRPAIAAGAQSNLNVIDAKNCVLLATLLATDGQMDAAVSAARSAVALAERSFPPEHFVRNHVNCTAALAIALAKGLPRSRVSPAAQLVNPADVMAALNDAVRRLRRSIPYLERCYPAGNYSILQGRRLLIALEIDCFQICGDVLSKESRQLVAEELLSRLKRCLREAEHLRSAGKVTQQQVLDIERWAFRMIGEMIGEI